MIPTLTTERLTLRAPTMADLDAYAAFYASDHSHIIGGPVDRATAWRFFSSDAGQWILMGHGWWMIDDGNGPAGICGLHNPPHHADVELAWSLYAHATGKGYATEAARAAREWAGDRWPRLVSYIDRTNAPSQAVARRLGATDTGAPAAHDPACNVWEHPR